MAKLLVVSATLMAPPILALLGYDLSSLGGVEDGEGWTLLAGAAALALGLFGLGGLAGRSGVRRIRKG